MIRREQCADDEEIKRQTREVMELVRKLPSVQLIEHDPSPQEHRRFVVRLDRERADQAAAGQGRG